MQALNELNAAEAVAERLTIPTSMPSLPIQLQSGNPIMSVTGSGTQA